MSVLLETSVGDVVIDLCTAESPLACSNFLKLCAIKYYNDCTFHTVKRDFLIQTGDPTNTGKGGDSIHRILAAASASSSSVSASSRLLRDERHPSLSHRDKYTVSMVCLDGLNDSAQSQFFITTAPGLQSLDGRHTVFGRVAEGHDAVDRINAAPVDETGRPAVHIRIRHTIVLDDPFPSPPELLALIPPASPASIHTPFDYEVIHAAASSTDAEHSTQAVSSAVSASASTAAAVNPHAVVLEMIGDLPSADVAPPENVLFVCKLNPITTSEDLRLIFSRFGPIVDCSIVTDSRTGASLCYAFIEYAERSSCESAYLKMDNIIIDDRRIRVDFSQSVSRQWRMIRQGGRGGRAGGGGRSAQVAQGRTERVTGSRWGEKRSGAGGAEQQLSGRREEQSREEEGERKDSGRQRGEERKEATRETDTRRRSDEKAEAEREGGDDRDRRGRDEDRHRRRREERDGDREREKDRLRHRERSRERRRDDSEEDERDRHSRHRHHRSSRSSSRHSRRRHRHDSSSSRSPSRSRSRSPRRA